MYLWQNHNVERTLNPDYALEILAKRNAIKEKQNTEKNILNYEF